VPLVYCVVVDKDRFDLDCTEKAMLVHGSVVDMKCNDRFFRCHITW